MKNLSRAAFGITIFYLLSVNFVSAQEKIDINAAPLEDLIKIIHIGEARALELISLRPFLSLEELTEIKGIGEKRLQDIKNQGLAWVGEISNVTDNSNATETRLPASPPPAAETQSPEIFEAAPAKLFGAELRTAEAAVRKSPYPILIAAAAAVFSGAIIIILKKGPN